MSGFGKTAKQWADEHADDDDIWIKGFRDGETRVRFLIEPDDFVIYREHYKAVDGVGYFPCAKDTGAKSCVGCDDSDLKVHDRTRKFAFPALDSRGNQQVFKVGSRVHRQLQSKAARLGTICNRDYTIVRSGKNFNEITYDIESGDKYPIEFTDELHNVGQILNDKYASVVAKLTELGSDPDDDPDEKPSRSTGDRIQPTGSKKPPGDDDEDKAADGDRIQPVSKKQKPAEPDAQLKHDPEQTSAPDEAQAASEWTAADYPDIDELSIPEIKAYLADPRRGIEFPERAPRGRLATLAKKWQVENPPLF